MKDNGMIVRTPSNRIVSELDGEINDFTFVLVAGKEQSIMVRGDFWSLVEAVYNVHVKLDTHQFNERRKGHAWKAPDGQHFYRFTVKSDQNQTVRFAIGTGVLADSTSELAAGVSVGAVDLTKLGANGQVVYAKAEHYITATPSITTTTIYTVPSGKKAYLMHAELTAVGDNMREYIELRANGNTVFHAGTDYVNGNNWPAYMINEDFNIYTEDYLGSGDTFQLYANRDAASPGSARFNKANIKIWLCDA